MSTNSFFDSLPDYLQLELRGAAKECADAIGECLARFSEGATTDAATLTLLGTHAGRLREDLSRTGFSSETLDDSELVSFSKIRRELVAASGSLTGVRRLQDIYFPGASVQKGRPYPRQKLESTRGMRLADRGERRQVVSVLVEGAPSQSRVAEFIANCRRIVPPSTVVEVRLVQTDFKPASQGLRLGGKLTGGRLGCRISHN